MSRNFDAQHPGRTPAPTQPRPARGTRAGRLRLLGAIAALCLPHLTLGQQFTFRQYGQQDGLSNLDVSALLQDRAGYLWVGTENGLFRYDGTDFERFDDATGLADTAVRSVIEDLAGRLWVGTQEDLYVLDGGRFRAVRPDGRELSVRAGARIAAPAADRLLVIDREDLRELSRAPAGEWHSRPYFTAEQLHRIPALSRVDSVYADRLGRLWLGCGEGICSVEGGRVRAWSVHEGVPADAWRSWLLDRGGRLWARGLQHVVVLSSDRSRFELRDSAHGKLTAGILNVPLIEDRQGRIITRSDMGVMRWAQHDWEGFAGESGITTPEISALLATRDGTLWLGMSGHGLWRWLGYGNFESWTVRSGESSNPVWVVLRGPDHSITLGTRAGCLRIDASSRLAKPCGFRGVPTGEVQVMAKRADGSLWLGLATGQLLRVAAGQQRAEQVAVVRETRKLFVDSADRLWICSNDGIRMAPAGSAVVEDMHVPKGLGEVSDAAEDRAGALWFATQGGLLRWASGQWRLLALPTPVPQGFAAVAPAANGWLWAAGASHGLMRVHERGASADQAQWIADSNIGRAAVYFAETDRRGWLWAGTDDGIVVFDGRSWRRYGESDGLIWNDTDQNAIFSDDDGSMWIGTSGGVTHILSPERLIDSRPLDLRIARASLGTMQLGSGAQRRLPWQRGLALDVRLDDLDFDESSRLRVRVRLQGLSDEWFDSREFSVHYPALAPERYTFEAVAIDTDHQRLSRPVTLGFEVLPPWWQTLWFKAGLALLIAAGVGVAWRWSAARHEARRRTLERELKEREALLERATRDPLTKLWNRQAILDTLSREMDVARETAAPLAVAIIDVDHFKRINDTLGHLAGDEVLRTLGARLAGNIRARDALGRYGGEELLLVLPGALPSRPFLPIERLRQLIAETPFEYAGKAIRVTASFGVAWFDAVQDTGESVLARADEALYAAKEAGRDRVEYAATGS